MAARSDKPPAADYLFKHGRVGVFGTKGFMDEPIVGSSRVLLSNGAFASNLVREQYLRIVDQAGVSGTVGLVGNTYAEGNIGYLKAYGSSDRVGGTLRFVSRSANILPSLLKAASTRPLWDGRVRLDAQSSASNSEICFGPRILSPPAGPFRSRFRVFVTNC